MADGSLKRTLRFWGVLTICGMVLTSCAPTPKDKVEIKNTPARIGTQGEAQVSLANAYGLDEAVAESDIVAEVTIVSWLGEDTEEAYKTYFDATVNTLFKGNAPDNIVLLQDGNSKYTYTSYPLFKIGDRMLLFLKKAVTVDYEDAYWIIGSYTSVMDIQTVGGVSYAVDRMGVLTKKIVADRTLSDEQTYTTVDTQVWSELHDQMASCDPLVSQIWSWRSKAFLYDEIIQGVQNESDKP